MTKTSKISNYIFGSYNVEVDASDKSAAAYGQRPWQEEFVSPFYAHIKDCLAPEILLDVGANYGVASLFMKHAMPDTPLIAVEANTELIPFIERNLRSNNKDGFSIINAIAGETPSNNASFSINKRGTQDSRVSGTGAHWRKIDVPVTTIDSLLLDYREDIPFFAKIDTQGYEKLPAVFTGLSTLRQMDLFLNPEEPLTPKRMNRNDEHGHAILLAVMARQAAREKGSLDGKSVIEIGCTREAVFSQGSTQKLAFFASIFGMEFTTVDMNPESIEVVKSTLRAYSIRSKAVVSKGEEFLAAHDESIDYLYLDAFDLAHGNHSQKRIQDYEKFLKTEITEEGCREMHLECAKALLGTLSNGEPRMPVGGVVVFDDTKLVKGEYPGKGDLAVPYLLENGFELITRGRATVALERIS